MKRFIYLLLFFISINWLSAQTLFVANNKPGAATGVNVLVGPTALQDAINAASTTAPYDVIYVVPGSVSYNNITIDRGLTIYGIGLRPAKDVGAKSRVNQVFIESSNVRISGLVSTFQWNIGTLNGTGGNYANITIENSRFRNLVQNSLVTLTIDQVLIRNNVILDNGWGNIELYVTSNLTITNNVIYCEVLNGGMIGNDLIVYNNFFVNNGSGTNLSALTNVDNSLFDHNIFYGASPANYNGFSNGNTWDDNLSWATSDDVFEVSLNGNTSNSPNLEGIDPIFVNMPLNGAWDNDFDFTLQAGSPALNINGTDIGPSGGGVPFDFEGNILPLIESVIIPAVVPSGSDLPVTIKAKGN